MEADAHDIADLAATLHVSSRAAFASMRVASQAQ